MAENQYMQPFFDTLSQGVQVAQSLRQSALQQQELDLQRQRQAADQDLRQQEQNRLDQQTGLAANLDKAKLIGSGAKPVDDQGNVPYATPAPQNDMSASPGQRFTLNGTANTQLPADAGRTMNVAGSNLEVPGIQDLLNQDLAKKKADNAVGKVPLTKEGSDMIGGMFPEGTQIDPAHMPGLASVARANALNGKEPKTKSLQQKGFTDKGEPITFDPDSGETTVGKPIPGMQAKPDSAAVGARALTENGRMTASNQAMNKFHAFESEEADLRQTLDRIDHAIALKGKYTVAVDDKGKSKLTAAPVDDAKTAADPSIILQDLQSQRTNIGNRLRQALNNKYDAGDQYAQLVTGKPSVWGMSRQRAASDLDAKLKGTPTAIPNAQPGQAAPAAVPNAAPGTPALTPAAATPTVKVGTIAVNRKTSERRQWDGTKWAPLPTR